jgi:pre-mRNA cleavage complex 2 protein Pcf11
MVAEDHAQSKASSRAIYNLIRQRLLSSKPDNMLPLVYVLDSILKNVKGKYIELVEEDAYKWIPEVYQKLQPLHRTKFEKVWRTWGEFQLFRPESLQKMGLCFDVRTKGRAIGSTISHQVAGINRTVR